MARRSGFGHWPLMTRVEAGKCPDNPSGRHFWIEIDDKTAEEPKRYRCRDCGNEVTDKGWPSGLDPSRP